MLKFVGQFDEATKKDIALWLMSNYTIDGDPIEAMRDQDNGIIINVAGNVAVTNYSIESLTGGLFKWGRVSGTFNCSNCNNLKSLEGAPQMVQKEFCCDFCKGLIDLIGSPEVVGGEFCCNGCTGLKSLKNTTKRACVDFSCSGCTGLVDLVGAPKTKYDFNCSKCTNLRSLKGSPETIRGTFFCNGCTSLINLIGAPKKIGSSIWCTECTNLESLKGLPELRLDKDSYLLHIYCLNCPKLSKNDPTAKKEARWIRW